MTQTYMSLIAGGVSTRHAAVLTATVRSTAARRRKAATAPTPEPSTPQAGEPVNKLTALERRRVREVLTSDRFVDLAPLQIYAQLLDEGVYLCSVSTMYRVLAENTLVAERRRLARHPAKVCPELVATGPRQVYSWDITKLAGPVKGTYFDAYVMIDIYSRYIVGVEVHAHESGVLAKELMEQVFTVHGVPQVVHADRGTSMTSKTVATLLADLDVTRSHSRPRVSNDNPYSESLFKTLKYGPEFPEFFGSLYEARQFMEASPTGTTTSIVTPASDYIHPPMCTTGWPPTKPPTGAPCSPTPAPDTRTASAPPPHRRSSTYPTPPGSTDRPKTPARRPIRQLPNTRWTQPP
jgi:putative transposase